MTPALVLDNLLAWSAQVAVLVVIAELGALMLSHPRARLVFWQGILALSLLLPVLEPWRAPAVDATSGVSITSGIAAVAVNAHPAQNFAWKREYLLVIVAAGAALRFLWIGAGLLRLRRHRLDARMLTIPPVPFSNPRVRWFISTTVGGPVTFGFVNPSILLPARVAELPGDLQEAIAHHELAHVRRRDWLFVLAEEAIRSALWFHPAMWFVLSRIQLAREQVVDSEVVGLTLDRERYLDALVAVAAQKLLPDVAPAPLFLKKRQLAARVAAVLKENPMSKPRMFLSLTTVGSAALLAASASVWLFPFQAPAQTPAIDHAPAVTADGPGVVVEPGAKIQHRPSVFFSRGVTVTGTVVVETTVNQKGEVTDARVLSGPDELRSTVLSSVLNWHFSTDGGTPPTVQSTIRFVTAPRISATTGKRAGPAAGTPAAPQYIKAIYLIGVSSDLADKVKGHVSLHVGDAFTNDDLARLQSEVKEVDEHLMVGIRNAQQDVSLTISLAPTPVIGGVINGVPGGTTGGIIGGVPGGVVWGTPGILIDGGPPVSASIPDPAPGTQRVRVGGNVQSANLVNKVVPAYPPLAKQARIQGVVRFTALIGKDGSILSLELVSGHPLLVPPAMEAVKQWQYKPTLLNGNPVEVITQIDVNFTLSE